MRKMQWNQSAILMIDGLLGDDDGLSGYYNLRLTTAQSARHQWPGCAALAVLGSSRIGAPEAGGVRP
jgi:hypothetical protein